MRMVRSAARTTISPWIRSGIWTGKLVLLLVLFIFSACYEFDNPYDPGSSTYQGYPWEREDDDPKNDVTYFANGATSGSVPVDTAEYAGGETVTILNPLPLFYGPLIRDGITQRFQGWNRAADGSGIAFLPGETLNFAGVPILLYAQWTKDNAVVGKIGPAGGFIFYDHGSVHIDGWRYLEASAADAGKASWSLSVPLDAGGTPTTIGSGAENTAAIVAALNAASQSGQAAQIADEFVVNGFSDWFLPSQEALQLIYTTLFSPGIAAFESAVYWSSSELDTDFVRNWNFISNSSANGQKTISGYWVRPVRRF